MEMDGQNSLEGLQITNTIRMLGCDRVQRKSECPSDDKRKYQMTISEFEFNIGQLALARGMVDLASLLRCATWATDRGASLEDALVESGCVTPEDVAHLRASLEEMSATQIREAVDAGETITMRTIVEQRKEDAERAMQELSQSIAVEDTLDASPPSLVEPRKDKELVALEGEARYEFREELGRGGMGRIVRAEDRQLQREIALKTVLPDTELSQPERRLIAEARLTGQLEHPSIIPVYELGQLAGGEPYYTMRVVTERSLETILNEMRRGEPDTPSLLHLVQIIRQVCLAIQYAHERGIIHRDLKPENILVGHYGEVFVIDWGIAKVFTDVSDAPSPTLESEDQPGELVGTPQYMSPEQAQGDHDRIDERTDVYALGTLLYEIMTLKPVFDSPTVLGLIVAISGKEPEPPSKRAPDRDIPGPLEEICLRALSKEPEDRYPSAQALAEELELFMEGVKEREKKYVDARRLIEEARGAKKSYDEAKARLVEATARRDELRMTIPSWADEGERAAIWDAEDRVEELEIEVERQFGQTVQLLGQSLGHASLEVAHDALATMYWERFVDAERRGDRPTATYFENLVRQHDTGAFTERLRGLARLSIEVEPPEAEIVLSRVTEQHRRLIPSQTVSVTRECLELGRLRHGRYRVSVRAEGYAPLQMPILLERLASMEFRVQLRSREQIPEDFVFIPAGEFLTGSPDRVRRRSNRINLSDFAIQRTPVTCGEYVEFLNDLAAQDMEMARRFAPRTSEEAPSYFPVVNGRFVVPEEDNDGDAWDPDWPICMVNHEDAVAYANWYQQKHGLPVRLPSSLEWEKAARGIDQRLYPWGNHFDPSFCRMRETTAGFSFPAPVGTYQDDTSPYGVRDMAGNICEWTSTAHETSPGTFVLRGGSYNSFPLMCRLDWHLNGPAIYRHSHYGFRLLLELT